MSNPIKLQIAKIQFKNIREFKDLEFDFLSSEDKVHKVSLIQMPNGTGKTTTMSLLRSVFSGRTPDSEEVKSYKCKGTTEGKFTAVFLFKGEKWTITLNFNYKDNSSYFTTKSRKISGTEVGHKLPGELELLLTREFCRLFIFDGELTKGFLEEKTDSKHIKALDAIEYLYYIDRIRQITNTTIPRVREKRIKNSSLTQARTVGSRQAKEKEKADWEKKRDEVVLRIKIQSTTLTNCRKDREKLESELRQLQRGNDTKIEEYRRLDEAIKDISKERVENTQTLMSKLIEPVNFSSTMRDNLTNLVDNLNDLKLPEGPAKEWFKDFALNEDRCICGEALGHADSNKRNHIQDTSSDYMGNDEHGIYGTIKTQIKNIVTIEPYSEKEEYEKSIKLLRTSESLEQRINMLDSEQGRKVREKISKLKEEITKLTLKQGSISQQLTNLTTSSKSSVAYKSCESIEAIREKIKQCEKWLLEATGNINFSADSERLSAALTKAADLAVGKLSEEIKEKSNRRLKRFLDRDDIEITEISSFLKLGDRDGVSEGQGLATTYAFLSTLFSQSPCEVPFIIDSPAGSLDIDVRSEVGRAISKDMFEQMIIFVISTERLALVDCIEENVKPQYITVWKDKKTKTVNKDETKDHFHNFQVPKGADNLIDDVRSVLSKHHVDTGVSSSLLEALVKIIIKEHPELEEKVKT